MKKIIQSYIDFWKSFDCEEIEIFGLLFLPLITLMLAPFIILDLIKLIFQ